MAMTPDEALARLRTGPLPRTVSLTELATEWETNEVAAKKRLQRWGARGQLVCAWPGGGLITLSLPAPLRDRDRSGDSLPVPQGQPLSVKELEVAGTLPATSQSTVDRGLAVLLGQPIGPRGQLTSQEDAAVDSVVSNVVPFRSAPVTGHYDALARQIEEQVEAMRASLPIPAKVEPAEVLPAPAPSPAPAAPRDSGLVGRRLLGLLTGVAASSLAYHALTMNWLYGKSLDEAHHLAGLGLTLDAVALLAPTIALLVTEKRLKRIAWTTWCAAVVYAFIATVGFSALNISNRTAETERDVDAYRGAREALARLEEQRRAIRETRAPDAIEPAVTLALATVRPDVVRITRGCTDVTLQASAAACTEVLRLREAQETARQRDALDVQIAAAKTALEDKRAVKEADPAPAAVAALANWLSRGWLPITAADVEKLRLLLLAFLPHGAGLLFEMAAALWRRRA